MPWLTPPLLWFEVVVLFLVCWCIHRIRKRSPGSRIARLRDWLAYVAISIALVIAIVVYASYGSEKRPISGKWIAFAINTAIVFGYTLKAVRPMWNKPKPLAALTGLFMLHGIIGWMVISKVERIPLVSYFPVDMAEIWAALIVAQLVSGERLPPIHKP
jgi:FtsH-binding integral membrane protein